MRINYANHNHGRDTTPVETPIGFAGRRIHGDLKYQAQRMAQIEADLLVAIRLQFMTPDLREGRHLRQGFRCLQLLQNPADAAGCSRPPRPHHEVVLRAATLQLRRAEGRFQRSPNGACHVPVQYTVLRPRPIT